MKNIKISVCLFIVSIILGFISPDIITYIFSIMEIPPIPIKYTFALGFTILLPLNQYIKLQPLLDSSKLTLGLRKNEISRLKGITSLKKKQSKLIMSFLLVLTLIPIIINMILAEPIDFLFRLLIGASIANIIYVFYSMSISEEISEFERDLHLKSEARKKIERISEELNISNKKDN